MKVQTARYAELPAERRAQLEAIAEREFAQFALVRETRWAEPDWAFLAFEGQDLAAFYNIVERVVQVDGVAMRAAGLNNLITMSAHRGHGVASRLLRQTQPGWFEAFGVECAMLLCADVLVPFYERLAWRKVPGPVVYAQPDGPRTWAANCMLLDRRGEKVMEARQVDLCGLPW